MPMVQPDFTKETYLQTLLGWADKFKRLGVRANADYPDDAERARDYGAKGIGLTRTEHMFFETERLPIVQKMILSEPGSEEEQKYLDQLLPFQRSDFYGVLKAMESLPVIIRLIDPPLHEFLPSFDGLLAEVTEMRVTGKNPKHLKEAEGMLAEVEKMREANPMLGLRGVRLGVLRPAINKMQVRAIFEAACDLTKEGVEVHPEVMIPVTCHPNN
jgi:pyruvate,orthophosphate dikinase